MKLPLAVTVAFMSGCFAACGSHEEPKQPDPPPVKDTAFGDMVGTMDKARSVQDTTLKQKEAMDRQLEQQETGATSEE
ncbi:MAG TPA: hypothetical protein VFS47_00680 [Steroidobacteraceae bacterium]|jgi:hypothetical protein|nr:hypothetical protein [Steroidobacteraceae bacterium]